MKREKRRKRRGTEKKRETERNCEGLEKEKTRKGARGNWNERKRLRNIMKRERRKKR